MQQDAIQAVRTLTLGRPYVAGAANTCCKPPAQSWFLRVLLTGSYGFLRVLTGSYGFLRVLTGSWPEVLLSRPRGRQVLGCNCERQARCARSCMAVVRRPTKRHACPVSVYAYWERIVFVRDFLHLTRGGPKGLALLRCRALPKRKDNTGAGGGSGGRSPPRHA